MPVSPSVDAPSVGAPQALCGWRYPTSQVCSSPVPTRCLLQFVSKVSPDTVAVLGLLMAVVLVWVSCLDGPIDLRSDAAVYYVLGTSMADGNGYVGVGAESNCGAESDREPKDRVAGKKSEARVNQRRGARRTRSMIRGRLIRGMARMVPCRTEGDAVDRTVSGASTWCGHEPR
jgi:hypothetical protein